MISLASASTSHAQESDSGATSSVAVQSQLEQVAEHAHCGRGLQTPRSCAFLFISVFAVRNSDVQCCGEQYWEAVKCFCAHELLLKDFRFQDGGYLCRLGVLFLRLSSDPRTPSHGEIGAILYLNVSISDVRCSCCTPASWCEQLFCLRQQQA
eukprot:g15505.t1